MVASHEAILLYGRYSKLSRECSQTPWNVDGKTTLHGSVEEFISNNTARFFGSAQGILHGSGREDIDVRMLGRGRPFVMEYQNPTRALSCHKMIDDMHNKL